MPLTSLSTTTERLGDDKVKLRVEVPEKELGKALDAAYRRWAKEIKVPGFRKGKVPRQIIDSRVGADVVREDALQDALPALYREALAAEELEAIASPDIQIIEFETGSPLVFEVTVDVRPEISVPDLTSISIQAPPSDVTDEDLDEQLERLRDRFAELDTVGREARRGDFALIDLNGYRHDEPVEGASAPDLLYEIGSRSGPPRLDDELEGNRPGAILKFTDTLPPEAGELGGQEISFTVLLKEVKAKRLPTLDDEFAKTVGEFDTLEELRDDIRKRLGEVKISMVGEEIARLALAALVDEARLDPPQVLVEGEFEHRLKHFEADLKKAGLTLDGYARQSDLTELEIRRDIRLEVERSVAAELLLEEIAREQDVEVTQEDVGREIAIAAARAGKDPKEVAEQVVSSGRLNSIAADIMRRKALDYVVKTINVSGRPVEESVSDDPVAEESAGTTDEGLEANPT